MNGAFARKLFGSDNDRGIKSCQRRVDAINALEAEAARSPDDVSLDDVAAKSPLSRTTFQ